MPALHQPELHEAPDPCHSSPIRRINPGLTREVQHARPMSPRAAMRSLNQGGLGALCALWMLPALRSPSRLLDALSNPQRAPDAMSAMGFAGPYQRGHLT